MVFVVIVAVLGIGLSSRILFYFYKFHAIIYFYSLIIYHQISVSVWLMISLNRLNVFTQMTSCVPVLSSVFI